MEIDTETGLYGFEMILSELPTDPDDAIREVVGAFTDSVEMNWLSCLETGGIAALDEIDQSQEMNLQVDLAGVDEPQQVIEALNGISLGIYQETIPLADADKTQLKVEITLSLEDVEEEESDFIEDFDDESDPETHLVAKFRADIEIK